MEEIKWVQQDGEIPDYVRDVSEELLVPSSGGAVVIGGPDWVRTPPQLGDIHGSKKLYIKRRGFVDMPCPVCLAHGPTYVMELETLYLEGRNMHASCCRACRRYGWFLGPVSGEPHDS